MMNVHAHLATSGERRRSSLLHLCLRSLRLLLLVTAPGAAPAIAAQDLTTPPPPPLSELPSAPEPQTSVPPPLYFVVPGSGPPSRRHPPPPAPSNSEEHFHWKGLILQTVAFAGLEDSTRIITADQADRHLLLNKPFFSDYWASLGQFNMRRWNDGDSFGVNYVGHPLQGAITSYIEIQNDPEGRTLRISRSRAYWRSRLVRSLLWSTLYSTESEIGPLGEAGIFNEGGFTYPIRCNQHTSGAGSCTSPSATYTNNTGWVDFIITPTVGTLWVLGEDTIDRFVNDPIYNRHPNGFGYMLLRAGLNPPRSLTNMIRGRYPWYRDYEFPATFTSPIYDPYIRALDAQPHPSADLHLFLSSLALPSTHTGCLACRATSTGAGAELGVPIRPYLEIVATAAEQPDASALSSPNTRGSLLTAGLGLRSGLSFQHLALKVSLSPGLASFSHATAFPTAANPNPRISRITNFSAVASISGDLRFSSHLALRAAIDQRLIRYKSPLTDPAGIGAPPRLNFLSHDNYINSTNWAVRFGPVLRF